MAISNKRLCTTAWCGLSVVSAIADTTTVHLRYRNVAGGPFS